MKDVLQLHLKMQRRSHLEVWIAFGSLIAFAVFIAGSLCINTYVEELDDTVAAENEGGDAPLARLLQTNNKKKTPLSAQVGAGGATHVKKKRTGSQLRKSMVRYEPPPADHLTVRQQFEREHPEAAGNAETIYQTLEAQRVPHPPPPNDIVYDIFDCPGTPPDKYPAAWNAMNAVLSHWNPDVTEIPSDYIHQGLCVFDWRNIDHRARVDAYRRAEVPFVLRHHPDVAKTAHRWQQPGYLEQLLGGERQRNERSHNTNHLMFWRETAKHKLQQRQRSAAQQQQQPSEKSSDNWKPPTEDVRLNITEWMAKADALERLDSAAQARADHWYFRLNAALPDLNVYLYDELPFFQPSDESTLFMVDSRKQRGINCRLGQKGSIAEAHFDPTRNWIVLLRGQRRYILAHPSQCQHMELYPQNHPSGRHSAVNWSNVSLDSNNSSSKKDRPFARAVVTEALLQAGDALYLPTSWLHFIVSLNRNYQCNARSGVTHENAHHLERCGFYVYD